MARNPDPKYGRFILPFVIAGMVGATWVFVNSLDPGDVPDSGTTVVAETTTTTVVIDDTGTTTSLPENVAAYLATLEAFVVEGEQLLERARQANNDWDDRAISFQEAENLLRQLAVDTQDMTNRLEEADTVPALEAAQLPMNDAANAMVDFANAMVDGLLDPNTSAGRVQAFADYQAAAAELRAGYNLVRERAGATPAAATGGEDTFTDEEPAGTDTEGTETTVVVEEVPGGEPTG